MNTRIDPVYGSSLEPVEVLRLLNPAYCAGVLSTFAVSYGEAQPGSAGAGVPFPLLFLCLPLTLHRGTRTAIVQHNNDFGLHRLLKDHPDILFELPERVEGLTATTREALLFGTAHEMLGIDASAGHINGNRRIANRLSVNLLGEDGMLPMRAAVRLGSWLSRISPAEVFLHLGLRP